MSNQQRGQESQKIWETRYQSLRVSRDEGFSWLEAWKSHLAQLPRGPFLDLGCGEGRDLQVLQSWGHPVVGLDFAFSGLRRIQSSGPRCLLLQADLERPLPFLPQSFSLVLASLSLHYVAWPVLRRLIAELWKCLLPGGAVLARFNSLGDENFGAGAKGTKHEELVLAEGILKRFFSKDDFPRLFDAGWKELWTREASTHRFGREKRLWEVWVEKAPFDEGLLPTCESD